VRDVVVGFVVGVGVFDDVFVGKQKLFAEEVALVFGEGYLRDEFLHVVEDHVLVVGVEVGVEGAEHEPQVDLVLDYLELFLEPFGGHLGEVLWYFCLAQRDHSLVLEVAAEGHLDEPLVGGYPQQQVVVVELAFELIVGAVVVEEGRILIVSGGADILVVLELVESEDDAFGVVGEVGGFDLDGQVVFPVLVEGELVDYFAYDVEAGVDELFVDGEFVVGLREDFVPFSAAETTAGVLGVEGAAVAGRSVDEVAFGQGGLGGTEVEVEACGIVSGDAVDFSAAALYGDVLSSVGVLLLL
jgi:hypothetical protein